MKTRSATILATIVTSLVAFTSASDALAQGTWTTIAAIPLPTSGVASYEASGVSLGGKFYVIDYGVGYGNPLPLNVYDPVTDSWSLKAADPVLRAETAAGVINNKIYVAEGWGGTYGSDSNAPTTALEIYDPATDSWTAGAPSLVARGWSATAVIGGKLYITGGTTYFQNPAIATLEIYDPNSNTWSTGAPIPVAPKKAVGAALNGKFYVVGGGVGAGLIATANVYIYDPTTDTWTSGMAMPSPRFGAAGGVINGKLYITGGNITVTDGTDNPVVVYDPITDTWSAGAAEPTPRYAAAAAAVDGKLYVAGGVANSTTVTSTAEAFTPASQLTALGPAQVWIGLKNSDDVGTKFDLLAEVLKNGVVVGSGQLNSVWGGSSGFNNAVLDAINLALSGSVAIQTGDTLSLRLSVRIAATGHRSGTARLWFNDAAANSRFSATIDGVASSYFLRSGFALAPTVGPGPKNTIDVLVDRAVGGNPFKPFGTWNESF